MARTERVHEVGEGTASDLRELWSRAEAADGVGAVSEAFRLAVGPAAREGVVHLLRRDDDGALVGYAQVAAAGSPDAVAELVVSPSHRRRGHGRALLDAALAEGARSVWAHGDLDGARRLAGSAGLERSRELFRMVRPLAPDADAAPVALPPGFSVRAFEPGRDDETWVRLNAAAFARHPEQGRLTLADLHERMAQPWFDSAGLLLVVDDATREVVAFHWTKVDPKPSRTTVAPTPSRLSLAGAADSGAKMPVARTPAGKVGKAGEVYVVGVHPTYQGRGLGGPVTALGLAHLARQGRTEVELYVDGDNTAARRTYARLGFEDAAVHVQYSLPAQS